MAIWYSESDSDSDSGESKTLVALHPGGTDARALEPLLTYLRDDYRVVTPERSGHGHSPDVEGEWSFADMARETAELMDELDVAGASIFGWSDGALVGLYLALLRPDLVSDLVFGGAPYDLNGYHHGVQAAPFPDQMASAYSELSPDGPEHWPVVVEKSRRLHEIEPNLTPKDLRRLHMPVLIVIGDDDEVRIEHAARMLEALPDGELAVIPRSTHGLIVEKPALLSIMIRDFHSVHKNDGVAPIRRGAVRQDGG